MMKKMKARGTSPEKAVRRNARFVLRGILRGFLGQREALLHQELFVRRQVYSALAPCVRNVTL